jgi:hypothetical protein
LPHALERVKAVAYFEAQTCYGNIAEACTLAVRRSAQHGCHPRPSRLRSSPGPCCWC